MKRAIRQLVRVTAFIVAAYAITTPPAPCLGQVGRETWQPPEKILDAIGVRPGMRVGEAGAGQGYFTFPLARRVGSEGVVFANDISTSSLDVIRQRAGREGLGNIKIVEGAVEDPLFPEKNLDMVVMVYVLHMLERPVPFLKNLHSYLKPAGQLVIIERNTTVERAHAPSFMANRQILDTVGETGYELDRTETFLPRDTIYVCKTLPASGLLDAYPDISVTRLSQRILQLKVRAPGFFSTNIVVVATQKGLVVIDTWHGPFIFEQVSAIVEQQFRRKDFAYVINSHEDVDHASGSGYFKDVMLVGHENLFKALKKRDAGHTQWQSWYRGRIQGYIKGEEEKLAGLDKATNEARELATGLRVLRKLDGDFEKGFPILPDNPKAVLSFKDFHVLELGDITVECHACPVGHTPSDILIHVPEEGFLFTGDATQVSIQKDVDMERWLAQLEHFLRPDVNVKAILGGHSEHPFTRQDLGNLRNYLATIWGSVQKAQEKGLALEQIERQYSIDGEMSRFHSMVGSPFDVGTLEQFKEKHKKNIETMVALHGKASRGSP